MRRFFMVAAICTAYLYASDTARQQKLQQAIDLMESKGDFASAMPLFQEAARSADRTLAARALLYVAQCQERQGKEQARTTYERIVKEFADQREISAEAQTRLAAMGKSLSSTMITRQVWTGPKVDILGTVSPDGRQLSFVDWETGDMAVRDLVTGENHRLTNKGSWTESGEFAGESAVSRDGKQVAYSWFNKEFRYELRLANLSGEPNPRRLFDNEDVSWMAPYDWTPDGKWIAVTIVRNDRTAQIGLVATAGGSFRVLKSVDWRGPTKLFLSPDGKYLAYDLPAGEAGGQRDVFLLAIDGSREIAVAHPANDVVMGWAPDGKQLLFASDRTGSMSVWMLPVADGKPQGVPELIKTDIGRPSSMGMTRAGALYLGVSSGISDLYVASVDLNSGEVLSRPARPVQNYIGSNGWPAWSPDGKYLSYVSERNQGARALVLAIRSKETGETRELTPNLHYLNLPRWIPDGRAISGQGVDRKGRQGIYRIDAQTGDTSPIVLNEPGVYSTPAGWSPDGKKLYYHRNNPATKEHLAIERDMASGKEREILRRKGFFGAFSSPDGRYLALRIPDLTPKSSALMVVPVSGGMPREVLRLNDPESVGGGYSVEWTPDSQAIVFRKNFAARVDQFELWMVSLDGSQTRKLSLNMENIQQLRIHPDGRQVAFTAGNQKSEVWVMENFLPGLMAAK
jgi:Tol biopolymer transport system component